PHGQQEVGRDADVPAQGLPPALQHRAHRAHRRRRRAPRGGGRHQARCPRRGAHGPGRKAQGSGRPAMSIKDITNAMRYLTEEEQAELDTLVAADIAERVWAPLPGPQTMAYESDADVVGFGGAAGGGKTDLAVGKALTQHYRTLMLRLEAPQL